MTKYLAFTDEGTSKSGKTRVVGVCSASTGYFLGVIKWYAPWRRYTFAPNSHIVFDAKCLNEIVNKIEELMEDRNK